MFVNLLPLLEMGDLFALVFFVPMTPIFGFPFWKVFVPLFKEG